MLLETKEVEDALPLRFQRLTKRENQVARFLIEGKINKEIGDELGITERTVKVHRSSIFKKLDIKSAAELTRLVDQLGSDLAYPMRWRTNASGENVWNSDEFLAFIGMKAAALRGDGWTKIVHPDYREMIFAAWRKAWKTRSSFSHAYLLRCADGAYSWVLDIAVPRFDESGEYLGHRGIVIQIDQVIKFWMNLISQDRTTSWGRHAARVLVVLFGLAFLVFAIDRYQKKINDVEVLKALSVITFDEQDAYLPEDYLSIFLEEGR
jgi:DNA-binding CsgD family transcriptional regulator